MIGIILLIHCTEQKNETNVVISPSSENNKETVENQETPNKETSDNSVVDNAALVIAAGVGVTGGVAGSKIINNFTKDQNTQQSSKSEDRQKLIDSQIQSNDNMFKSEDRQKLIDSQIQSNDNMFKSETKEENALRQFLINKLTNLQLTGQDQVTQNDMIRMLSQSETPPFYEFLGFINVFDTKNAEANIQQYSKMSKELRNSYLKKPDQKPKLLSKEDYLKNLFANNIPENEYHFRYCFFQILKQGALNNSAYLDKELEKLRNIYIGEIISNSDVDFNKIYKFINKIQHDPNQQKYYDLSQSINFVQAQHSFFIVEKNETGNDQEIIQKYKLKPGVKIIKATQPDLKNETSLVFQPFTNGNKLFINDGLIPLKNNIHHFKWLKVICEMQKELDYKDLLELIKIREKSIIDYNNELEIFYKQDSNIEELTKRLLNIILKHIGEQAKTIFINTLKNINIIEKKMLDNLKTITPNDAGEVIYNKILGRYDFSQNDAQKVLTHILKTINTTLANKHSIQQRDIADFKKELYSLLNNEGIYIDSIEMFKNIELNLNMMLQQCTKQLTQIKTKRQEVKILDHNLYELCNKQPIFSADSQSDKMIQSFIDNIQKSK